MRCFHFLEDHIGSILAGIVVLMLLLSYGASTGCSDVTMEDSDDGGGQCVPGAMAMCWCDGLTPGTQLCREDKTFEPCVCGGSTSGVSSSSGYGETGALDGSGGSGSSGTVDSTDGTGPGECSPEVWAFWHFCYDLAYFLHKPPCDCQVGNYCEQSLCDIECPNAALEDALEACDDAYQECVDLLGAPTKGDICRAACYPLYQQCAADLAPRCEQAEYDLCTDDYQACLGECPEEND